MIRHDFPLRKFNSFGLDVKARTFINLASDREAREILSDRQADLDNLLILGGGSNILFTDDFQGTIMHPGFRGIENIDRDNNLVTVAVAAGTVWDEFVEWAVKHELGGVENLSYIPGTVGAVPVQNIGAYGVEVSSVVKKVYAISLSDGSYREFSNSECRFGYRDSIFKSDLRGKYFITRVIFELTHKPNNFNIIYGHLQSAVTKLGPINLDNIRRAVIDIRKEKLPDPSVIGNAGSFFKNPVIGSDIFETLCRRFQDMPSWPAGEGHVKVPAGWLIDKLGWKGKSLGKAGVHPKQALVLVNHGNATGMDILNLSDKISTSVFEEFGITLEREVIVI